MRGVWEKRKKYVVHLEKVYPVEVTLYSHSAWAAEIDARAYYDQKKDVRDFWNHRIRMRVKTKDYYTRKGAVEEVGLTNFYRKKHRDLVQGK